MSSESEKLLTAAQYGIRLGNNDLSHLSNKASVANYINVADEIKRVLKEGRLLDWGCGYGHMTYLLRNRNIESVPYEIEKRNNFDKIPIFSELNIIYGNENFKLPYENNSFDAVLSCGTIEHVADINSSMIEIKRVLKKGGILFIYMLPNKQSYTEWIAEKRGLSVHPVKFNKNEISEFLQGFGYKIIKIKRNNILPKSLIGLPSIIKNIYGSLCFLIIPIDRFLAKIPLINYFCGVFEVIAIKN
ncbi:MAG: hypothetical protein A2551_07980 [Elusimicrobia bacterium RIFOXYD2_FULL_34_30]|nr:MAG: hypothetical protein A2551_07980 [Elusimicrobia bacterium RIFOXYD2_FULL_34_30]